MATAGYLFGYGYWLSPYGTAYRTTLRTTRTRLHNRTPPQVMKKGGSVDATVSTMWPGQRKKAVARRDITAALKRRDTAALELAQQQVVIV